MLILLDIHNTADVIYASRKVETLTVVGLAMISINASLERLDLLDESSSCRRVEDSLVCNSQVF